MIESTKDTMSPDGTNFPKSGFLAMAKGALCQQGWPPQGKEGLFFLGEVKKLLGEQEMKNALDFGPICAIMDWHPCMLSYVKFQETIVPPMLYGIELCTEYACENEGKAVIKSCYFCGYADLMQAISIVTKLTTLDHSLPFILALVFSA
ncbi:hypothetical protein FF1_015689 [Malus domestica]